jgi:hypothetical protein
MRDTDAAKKVELAQKHINYQRQCIVRHKLDRKAELLPAAHELLKGLEHVLAGMMAEQGRAQERT